MAVIERVQSSPMDISSFCVLSVKRRQKISIGSRERIGPVKIHMGLGHSFWCIGVVPSQHRACWRAKCCAVCFTICSTEQWTNPWDNHRTRKRSITSLDILVFVTLYELAHPLSDTNFCTRNRVHFQTQPRYVVCKNALFGCGFEQENWKCVWKCVSGATTRACEMHLLSD